MPVESCTQALSDVALSFGEDDEQEESRMVTAVYGHVHYLSLRIQKTTLVAGCSSRYSALDKPRR